MLGDELQQRGDPQGELIGLQLALEALPASAPPARKNMIERKIEALLDQHHHALYGSLAPHMMRLSQPDILDPAMRVTRWRGGFADEIWVQRTQASHELVDVLAAIRELPIARFVRRLELGAGNHVAAIADLARAPLPFMRELVLGDTARYHPRLQSVRLPLASSIDASRLESLEIKYSLEVDVDALPVRKLEIYRHWESRGTRSFDLDVPALEDLTCYWFRLDRGFLTRYPALRRLSIGGDLELGWVEAFLRSTMIERIETISLGSLTDGDLIAIRDLGTRLANVKRFEISGTFSAQGRVAVYGLMPPCVRYKV